MVIAMAATSIVLTLVVAFLLYLEIGKIEKQILEIQEQIHYLNNEVSRIKQQAKKKYYPNYFLSLDLPCSEILTYKTETDYIKGKDPLNRKVYY